MPEAFTNIETPIAADDSSGRGLYLPASGHDIDSAEFVSLTVNKPVRLGPNTWKLSWSSILSNVTFSIYRDGELALQTKLLSHIFYIEQGESPVFEIIDTPGGLPSVGFPGNSLITWYAIAGTDHYRVEEFVAAVWTLQRKIVAGDKPYFNFRTRWLEDVTIHQFRVIAVGTNGNESTAKLVNVFMVRHPDPPLAGFAYNGAGPKTVTITEL